MRRLLLVSLLLTIVAGCGGGGGPEGTAEPTIPATRVGSSCDPVALQAWMDEIQPLIDEAELLKSDAFGDRTIDATLQEHQDRLLTMRRAMTSQYPPCSEAQTYQSQLFSQWDELTNALRYEGNDDHERALASLDRVDTVLAERAQNARDVLDAIIAESQE
jgi:hypothetical protein